MRFGQPIVMFILVSGGVHAAALALAPPHSAPAPGQVASSLQVRLTTSNAFQPSLPRPVAAKAQQRTQSAATQHTDRRAVQKPRRFLTAFSTTHEVRTETTTLPQSRRADVEPDSNQVQVRTAKSRSASANSAAHTAASLAQRRNHIRARLQRELATFFRYPYMARRRGWHGRVVLGLSIMPSGQISRVAVQQSSGHALLDEAALTAVHRITTLDWAPALLQGDAVEIQLPVIYRLLGG